MLNLKKLSLLALVVVVFVSALVSACAPPAPRRTLTTDEKIADLYWLFSKYGENYAPLEYKQTLHGINFDALKRKYLEEVTKTKDNTEFYSLMYRFIAEFKDAHNSGSLEDAGLPDRNKIGYLGFHGKRMGNTLQVTEVLPSKRGGMDFPIRIGDTITKLDGKPLNEIVLSEMVNYRNLGQDDSSLTYHMDKIFTRLNLRNGLPDKDIAILSVKRGDKEEEVTLPWVVQDLQTYIKEQSQNAAKTVKKSETDIYYEAAQKLMTAFEEGKLRTLPSIFSKFQRWGLDSKTNANFKTWNNFMFVDSIPSLDSNFFKEALIEATQMIDAGLAKEMRGDLSELRSQRLVPGRVIHIEEMKTYSMYLTLENTRTKDGKPTANKKFVAYLFLNTFSPGTVEDQTVNELKAAIDTITYYGAKDVIIDMINNGGGSLSLGMKLAQALSNKKLAMPDMQIRLNESWVDDFDRERLEGSNSTLKELSRRAFNQMLEDQKAGKRLSQKINSEFLIPYQLQPNLGLKEPLNIYLLVNEMCASMCDIFTGILKDNGVAKVIGSKTMGAGGNVVEYGVSPNANLSVRMTESLIIRSNGEYIENVGITPDYPMTVHESYAKKYEPVRQKAMELILTEPEREEF